MTRIISGRSKGRRLKSPKGDRTRPTGARVKQTLFDIIAPEIPGSRFLDAFAGGGAVGLEALSRGADRVVLIDIGRDAVRAARENVEALGAAAGQADVFQQDARVALPALADEGRRFDIVYLDPPYDSPLYEPLLQELASGTLLADDGLVAVEHFHKRVLPERIGRLQRTRSVRVGDHRISFFRFRGEEAAE